MVMKKGEPVHYQYSEIIRRPDKNDPDSAVKLPEHLIGSYIDPELWAYSTLPPCDSASLVNIYEVKQGDFTGRETIRQRMWLHDILDDNGIQYQVEINAYWAARKRFSEVQCIYVEEENAKKARSLIKEYNNPENWIAENAGGENTGDVMLDGIPQKTCQSCGETIDFDYHKCPHCKAAV